MELKKSGDIKNEARKRLLSCWAESVSMLLINVSITVVIVLSILLVVKFCYTFGIIDFDIDHVVSQGSPAFFVAVVAALAVIIFLASPLSYGENWFYMQAVLGRKAPASSFFGCYTNKELRKRVFKLNFYVSIRKFVMFIPVCLLIIVELLAAEHILVNTNDSFIYSVIICCFVLVSAGAAFGYILLTMRYSLVKYIYALNPEKPVQLIIKESVKCMAGNESYILEVFMSMGLWIASCIFIFPAFYAVPYIKMVSAVTAKELIEYSGDIKVEKKRSGQGFVKEENTFV
ncbi:MAG: hypothetical protein IJ007_04875 [Oscillospiraceae bacterium]|nr:hypothetical protein [Oscillospiraceae bacterium]